MENSDESYGRELIEISNFLNLNYLNKCILYDKPTFNLI